MSIKKKCLYSFIYEFIGLSFHDVDKRVKWRWEHEGVILDEDGSLTGQKNYQLLPNSGIVNSTVCQVYGCFVIQIQDNINNFNHGSFTQSS